MAEFDGTSQKLIVVARTAETDKALYVRPVTWYSAYRSYWKNFMNFQDRTSRGGYWWVVLVNVIIAFALFINMYMAIRGSGAGSFNAFASFNTIAPIVMFAAWPIVNLIPGLALTVRRLHDTGRSIMYYFFAFIPVAGPIIMVAFLTADTQIPYINRYGYRPQV